MRLEVKEKNEEGELETVGTLNPKEVSFLVQYAINELMAKGCIFEINKHTETDEIRITLPDGATLQ